MEDNYDLPRELFPFDVEYLRNTLQLLPRSGTLFRECSIVERFKDCASYVNVRDKLAAWLEMVFRGGDKLTED